MRICTAETKAAHPRTAWEISRGPGFACGNNPERTVFEIDMRIDRCAVQRRRQDLSAHGHENLDDAGNSSGGFQVTDVGLHRSKADLRTGTLFRTPKLRIGAAQAVYLDRIAKFRARPMRLDVTHRCRINAAHRVDDELRLGLCIWRRQGARAAAMIFGSSRNHPKDTVTIALGIGERFQQQRGDTFTACVAIGARPKGRAMAGWGQHARLVRSFEALK